MDFLSDDEVSDLTLQQFLQPQIVSIEINYCCGKNMTILNHNSVCRYECDKCGKYIMSNDSFDNKTEITFEYERPVQVYGLLSGYTYIRKMKEELKMFIQKLSPLYNLNENEMINVMDNYFTFRNANIQRAKPRKGIICACINKTAKIPVDLLSKFFNLDQHYITEGQKIYNRKLTPFSIISIDDFVDEEFKRAECHNEKIPLSIRQNIIDIIKLSLEYYIAIDTTIKTKVAGLLLYFSEANIVNYDINHICKILDIGKNTIYKFYDQFVISLYSNERADKSFAENRKYCREQMIDYMSVYNIPVIPLPAKKRLDKYREIFVF